MAHGQSLIPSPVRSVLAPPVVAAYAAAAERDQGAISGEPAGFDSRIAHLWIAHRVEQSTSNRSVAGSTPAPKLSFHDSLCNAAVPAGCGIRKYPPPPRTGLCTALAARPPAGCRQRCPDASAAGQQYAKTSLRFPRRCRAKGSPGRCEPAPIHQGEAIC